MYVGIVGAGVSGLYTALLLRREGHTVMVFEAADRVGGRIYTHRFTPQGKSEDIYFEAGAMRIPRSSLHSKVFDLIRYLNTHSSARNRIDLIPYILDHENNRSFFRNQKGALQDKNWAAHADLPDAYRNQSPQELLGKVVLPWLTLLRQDFDLGFQKLLEYDEYSFRIYLRLVAGWPHEVIDFVELFCSQTNQYDLSFTEVILQNLDFDTKDWATVRGGMSRITQSAASLVGSKNIRLNSRVDYLAYQGDDKVVLSAQGLHQRYTDTFDAVVIATPPSALHSIVDRPRWSFMKEQSIRSAHYEPLYKIGFHFRSRFWERLRSPCIGGQSTTDLRFRWIVFPSNDIGTTGSGVLLLYCWMSDAAKWASLSKTERIKVCLHDLAKFYADEPEVDIYQQYIEAFDIMWTSEYAGGDAQFLPGQFSRFYDIARKPEGRIYFAGEHLSKHHTWIAGAVDSSLHTTAELLAVHGETNKDRDLAKPLAALGREFLSLEDNSSAQKTDLGSRRIKAYMIPANVNVQYVEVF